jgi:hypothetical protein
MTSYLVRIYRKEENNPRVLVGVVEEVGVKDKKAFHNLYELWDILNPLRQSGKVDRKVRNRKKKQNNGKFTKL